MIILRKILYAIILIICILITSFYLHIRYENYKCAVRAFNSNSVADRFSCSIGNKYYFVSNQELYCIEENGEIKPVINDAVPIYLDSEIVCTEENIYYLNDGVVRYNPKTGEETMLELAYKNSLELDIRYHDLRSYGNTLFVSVLDSRTNGNSPEFVGIFNDDSTTIELFDESKIGIDTDNILNVAEYNGYKFFYSNFINANCITGILNSENEPVYQDEDFAPLYFDGKYGLFVGEYEKGLLLYDFEKNTIEDIGYSAKEGYMYIPENTYFSDGNLYILYQQITKTPEGIYNVANGLHHKDILVKVDCKNFNLDSLYETENSGERIIGYQSGNMYLFSRNKIYIVNLQNNTKSELTKFNKRLKNASFEFCGDRLFVWENDEMIFTAEL